MSFSRSKFNFKVRAFTLTEVLVVVAISAVVVSLGFMSVNLLTKNVNSISSNYSLSTKLKLLEQQLALDLNRYPKAAFSEFDRKLTFSSPLDSISYVFEENVVLRGSDSLFFTILENNMYFKGALVKKGTIDAIGLLITENETEKKLFLYKRNDALTLLLNGD